MQSWHAVMEYSGTGRRFRAAPVTAERLTVTTDPETPPRTFAVTIAILMLAAPAFASLGCSASKDSERATNAATPAEHNTPPAAATNPAPGNPAPGNPASTSAAKAKPATPKPSAPAGQGSATPAQARSFASEFACSSPLCAHLELFEVGEQGPVEVAVDIVDATNQKQSRVGAHTFASVEAFASCLRNTGAPATRHGPPDSFGQCTAPKALADALLSPRTGPVPGEYSCQGDCCSAVFDKDARLVRAALRVSEVCLRPGNRGARKIVLQRSPANWYNARADITRKLAIDFGSGDGKALRAHFGEKQTLRVNLRASSDTDGVAPKNLSRNFASGKQLIDCLRVAEERSDKTIGTCRAGKQWAALLKDRRHAFTEVRECTPRCCELSHTNDRHHTLFLERVCFDPTDKKPVITGLELRSSD